MGRQTEEKSSLTGNRASEFMGDRSILGSMERGLGHPEGLDPTKHGSRGVQDRKRGLVNNAVVTAMTTGT
ncbi:MAG: hypothetical protein ACETVV_00540 [Nitrososphaeria archaeon]